MYRIWVVSCFGPGASSGCHNDARASRFWTAARHRRENQVLVGGRFASVTRVTRPELFDRDCLLAQLPTRAGGLSRTVAYGARPARRPELKADHFVLDLTHRMGLASHGSSDRAGNQVSELNKSSFAAVREFDRAES